MCFVIAIKTTHSIYVFFIAIKKNIPYMDRPKPFTKRTPCQLPPPLPPPPPWEALWGGFERGSPPNGNTFTRRYLLKSVGGGFLPTSSPMEGNGS